MKILCKIFTKVKLKAVLISILLLSGVTLTPEILTILNTTI